MATIETRAVWQTNDPAVAGDVTALWDELAAVFPKDRSDRLKELAVVAYDGGRIAGACTARAIDYKILRAQVFHLRPVIRPGERHDEVLFHLLAAAKASLQPWAQARPAQRLKGMLLIFNSAAYDGLYPEPILRRQGVELVLSSCTDEGHQIRVIWFDDARLEK